MASGTLSAMSRYTRRSVAGRLIAAVLLAPLMVAGLDAAPVEAAGPLYPHQSLGNRGANVRAIQGFLRHRGYGIAVDGIFAASTRTAVVAFQTGAGLPVDGRVNGPTWGALLVRLAIGATGEAVMVLQRQLNEKRNVGLAVNGTFDEATATQVKAFQGHAGLTRTGIVGPGTWRHLITHFERPVFGAGKVCDYSVGNGPANWGTGAAIGQIEAAARRVVELGHGRVAIGDIGFEHGGSIPGHTSHKRGLDVDVRPMRTDERQCQWRVNYHWSSYDRAATRSLVKAIRATAPGHVKLIYFNDPVLIREGLTRWYTGHDDHLHIRYCEKIHPVSAYDC